MENLIARVAAAADNDARHGAPGGRAWWSISSSARRRRSAVDALARKAPALKAIVASIASTAGEGMSPAVKGLMGTGAGAMGGGGLMALGGDLMALGLGMGQIQAVGKEVFDYARETAGDDVLGEISAAIPGLSQFI